MYQKIFSDSLKNLQESNQKWWDDFEQGHSAINSPLTKAMHELSMEDSSKFLESIANQPASILAIQMDWWQKQMQIWQQVVLANNDKAELISPDSDDKRFQDECWKDKMFFNFIKQSYLLFGKSYLETINSAHGLDDKVKERMSFFARQAINAMSPSNYVATNPELLKLTIEKNGANLFNGLQQLQEDVEASADILKVRMTSNNAFRIGVDVANTPGDVVFKNDLFELIQYRPLTKKVNATPLLIVPPFINKYYILDLREKNSMVRWLLEQGHAVFMISWRNPGLAQRDVQFSDYVTQGVMEAVNAVEKVTGQAQINAAGYCIGGTVLACALAVYAAKRSKTRIKSATFFTTLLDFSQPGEVGAYVNDGVVSAIEMQNLARGYMDGRSLSVTFSLLRENSLYWNYYIDNYLKGQSPVDFDMLYWNSDSTNVAAATHNFLLRELYLNNKLVSEKGVQIDGVWVDLSKIKTPTYFISTKEDHIALWQGTYRGALKLGGNKTFVLGQSGHIAGIVNHPAKGKYGYWINSDLTDSADKWLDNATHNNGSWWTHWDKWLGAFNPKEKVAPYPQGSSELPILETAPGQYVKAVLPLQESQEAAPAKKTAKKQVAEPSA
ncbi:MAG: class I poly(R)-hydroxyalkanoic acid synthase [Vibrionaceae bacterium]